jgi:hypothetical protein
MIRAPDKGVLERPKAERSIEERRHTGFGGWH